jgi:Acyl-CoA thioester hydrolase/BAAT N-terminal region/BAAT / Acyl-CoA thioester hydrolase C terminal
MRKRDRYAQCALALLVGLLAGCTSATPSRQSGPVVLRVDPASSVEDQPVHIQASGFAPNEDATLEITSVDSRQIVWAASATFRADSNGHIDVDKSAPSSGSYTSTSGMGLIWSMQPSAPATDFYIWSPRAFVFALTAKVRGQSVASTTFQRMFSAGTISEQTESLGTNGFVGQLYSPIGLTAPQPAILLFGGSEGGLPGPLLPALLAGHGYSVLTLAYFKEPGLPQTLSNIPLDYFATALTWLSRRPYVDPKQIVTFGVSRGSEAAQLLGVYYPDLVHGVIA